MLKTTCDVLLDTLKDSIKVFIFLFITYLILEYLEHKTSKETEKRIKKSGKIGPLWGSILGIFPQCGFSAAASNFYVGRVITLGTLISIYLSTSDEMLPILISEEVSIKIILKILFIKVIYGMIIGFIIDRIFVKKSNIEEPKEEIHHMCEHDHCHCDENTNVFKSAFIHSLQIIIFVCLISLALNLIITFIGEDNLSNIILNKPIIGEFLSGIVGLIPNCASSVVITELYLNNAMSFGALISGLLVNAGVGLLVLFKVNHNKKENLKILSILYFVGVLGGLIINLLRITA